jgi:hypothetical protein
MNLAQAIDPERARNGLRAPGLAKTLSERLLEARVAAQDGNESVARVARHVIGLAERKPRKTGFAELRPGSRNARILALVLASNKPLMMRDICASLRIGRASIKSQLHYLARERWLLADRSGYPARYSPGPRASA